MSWQQKVLRVNLSDGSHQIEALNMEWAQQYMGERGLATKYLWESMDPSADAMSPENVLIFATGPLTGTMASTSGRYAVITKGPLTGAIACSNSGGKFGAELKYCGFDLLILHGKSPHPVYLLLEDDHLQILPADQIWGTTVWDTESWIKAKHQDPQLKVASIGVAGEKGVRYACIVNDLHRAAGRSGVGAVMGSKQLKAIACRGTTGVTVREPQRFMDEVYRIHAQMSANTGVQEMGQLGTNSMVDMMQTFGGLPTHNFRQVQFDGAENINPEAVQSPNANGHTNHVTNKACFGCTIACGRIAHIDKHHFTIVNRKKYWHASGGVEYEMAYALGSVVGVDDLDAITFACYLNNEHGLDPISFGATLAAAMELYELGIISKQDTDGVELNFGNAEALTIMAEKTGLYEGFGQVLGLGAKRLCEKYGRPEFFMGVKGQEFAGYDSRALQGMGLGYATSNRGACHLKHDTFGQDMEDQTGAGKAAPCKNSQDKIAFIDSTGLCLFTSGAVRVGDYAAMLDAACEGDWDKAKLFEVGERVWNLERMFNLRAGFTKADDTLPPRMLKEPAPSGTAHGKVNELEKMLPEYYQLRGWDTEGVPTSETLQRLQIAAGAS